MRPPLERGPDIVLIRHGETEWSRSGRHTGHTDIPLTDEGRRVAAGLPRALSAWSFSRVLTSPLIRAQETCRLAGLLDRAEQVDDLMEWDYGDDEGRTSAEIQRDRPGWRIWDQGPAGGESLDQVAERADRVIEALAQAEGDVAIFSHGHLLRVLGARWARLAPTTAGALMLGTAAISVLGFEHGHPVISRWNDLSHLLR
jgi:probable phosphoglycerate mutase